MTARKIHVLQGGQEATLDPDVVLTTVLGSCVSACIRDPLAGVGGMNHFLVGEPGPASQADDERYGAFAMELLINALLTRGACRNRLEAKLFGGARMFDALSDIGAHNADFARRFLAAEGVLVVGASLGGTAARRVEYWPVSGRARQRLVSDRAAPPVTRPVVPAGGELELF
jgi:chemotaxis protein CheD